MKRYTPQEREEAVKLTKEIGARGASERLGISIDTIYTWKSKAEKRNKKVSAIVEKKGTEGLVAENEALQKKLKKQEEEIAILQDALGFFVNRRKK